MWALPYNHAPIADNLRSVLQGSVWTESPREHFVTHAPGSSARREEPEFPCRFRVTRSVGQFSPGRGGAANLPRLLTASAGSEDAVYTSSGAGRGGRRCARIESELCCQLNKNPELTS